MARSSYIYLITVNKKPYGAFTVKREMEFHLPSDGKGVGVYRIKDNDPEVPVVDITNDYYECD